MLINVHTYGAVYTSIIVMTTVVNSPSSVYTATNISFSTNTVQIIKPNLTNALSIECCICSSNWMAKHHFTTYNLCIIQIPSTITHCTPYTIVIHLHSTFILGGSISKANCNSNIFLGTVYNIISSPTKDSNYISSHQLKQSIV